MTQELKDFQSAACGLMRAIGWENPSHLHVLVIDDSQDQVLLLKKLLERRFDNAYQIDHAIDVRTALSLLPKFLYDAYLVDWLMPSCTGDVFIKTAYANGFTGPFIVWSGTPFTELELSKLCGGIPVGLIPKTADVATVDSVIRASVAEYRKHHLSGIVVSTGEQTKVIQKTI